MGQSARFRFGVQRCADNKLSVVPQAVEEGIKASDVPAVLQKCTSDLLDLTDLVRGKLGTQVGCSPHTTRRSSCIPANCSHTDAAWNAEHQCCAITCMWLLLLLGPSLQAVRLACRHQLV